MTRNQRIRGARRVYRWIARNRDQVEHLRRDGALLYCEAALIRRQLDVILEAVIARMPRK